MSIWEELDAKDKKGVFASDNNTTSYPTGIPVLDYANGYWAELKNSKGENIKVPMIGIHAGSLNSIIGNTGTGKTTLALQIGWNIAKRFPNGMLFLEDCEKTMTKQRMISLAGANSDDPRLRLIKAHTSIEDVLENFNKICDTKEAGGKTYMYEIKDRSIDGKPFWMYVPTIYIIDSLPSFNGKEYNTDDLGNNIDQMKAAKDITRFYTNILDKAWKYNCIFFVINHIRPNTIMNQYAQPPQGLLMINPQTETLPRGHVAQYFSSTYFRIKTKKSAAYTVEDEGFVGYKCDISLAKSKTNVVGTTFPVAFNSANGFDPYYSTYEFAHSIGLIQGRNPYLYVEGFEARKFSRKLFANLMMVDKEFREGVLTVLRPYFEALLGEKPEDAQCEQELPDGAEVLEYGDMSMELIA